MANSAIERFEKFVSADCNSGCWLWSGSAFNDGYGAFWLDGKTDRAHRASWTIHWGEIPEKDLVCHKCDTPMCVNPDHLFLGSSKENTQDMLKKGRHNTPAGDRCYQSKITASDVPKIKAMIEDGFYQREIAALFGVSRSTISAIKRNKNWKGVS